MKIYNKIARKLTKNASRIPLLWVTFDLNKFHAGVEKSCMVNIHPSLKDDEKLKQMTFEMVDYIRTNYDMNKIL